MTLHDYLHQARLMGIVANFWLTEEYLAMQDIYVETDGRLIWIQEDEWAVFPPLPLNGIFVPDDQDYRTPPIKIWSDFSNYSVGEAMEFLDWEYTYDADQVVNMRGGQWAVFRKNSRKWPRNRSWRYSDSCDDGQVAALLAKWVDHRSGVMIHDPDTMVEFVMYGSRRGFLFDRDRLVGVNVWDTNDPYLMYRYCVTDPEEPFLNEFARLLFYQSVPGRMVIDGGSLGNEGLERFKDKLNPVSKRAIYSRIAE